MRPLHYWHLRLRSDRWLSDLRRLQRLRVWWWLWRVRHARRTRLVRAVALSFIAWVLLQGVACLVQSLQAAANPPVIVLA